MSRGLDLALALHAPEEGSEWFYALTHIQRALNFSFLLWSCSVYPGYQQKSDSEKEKKDGRKKERKRGREGKGGRRKEGRKKERKGEVVAPVLKKPMRLVEIREQCNSL